jgi:hypothetical protein
MKNMKRRAAAVLLLAAVGGWNGVAWANHFTGACASELNAVETAIRNGVFLGKNASTDQTNLLAKLEAAAAKVGLKKYDDAVDKLQDISDKATELASAPKSKLEDASGINGAVITAIACVGGL